MYKKHTHLNEPQNLRQNLWHYLKYERLVELINGDFLYFPHITNLNDKLEGLLTIKTKEKLYREEYAKSKNDETARSATEQYEKHKDAFIYIVGI